MAHRDRGDRRGDGRIGPSAHPVRPAVRQAVSVSTSKPTTDQQRAVEAGLDLTVRTTQRVKLLYRIQRTAP